LKNGYFEHKHSKRFAKQDDAIRMPAGPFPEKAFQPPYMTGNPNRFRLRKVATGSLDWRQNTRYADRFAAGRVKNIQSVRVPDDPIAAGHG
jgi:hypothetical protein